MDPADVTFFCSQCQGFVPRGLQAFQRHLRQNDHLPPYVCGQAGCSNQYSVRSSLYEHLRHHHCHIQVPNNPAHAEAIAQAEVDAQAEVALPPPMEFEDGLRGGDIVEEHGDPCRFDEFENIQQDQDHHQGEPAELFPVPVDLQSSAEIAILNMRSVNYMTGAAIGHVQDQCFMMMQDTACHLKLKVMEFLSQPEKNVEDVEKLLNDFSLSNPFQRIKTKKQQMKIFESKFGMLTPKEIFLGPRSDSRQHPERPVLQPRQLPNSFQYMSIIEICKSVMLDDHLRNLILSEKASEDGCLRNFRDGSLFQTLPPDLRNALRITLYIDDLELVQALSAQKNIYKIAGIYFGIQNLPNELNSLLTFIFVTALAYAEDAKHCKVWEPFLEEMKQLETEGVEIIVNGEPFRFKAVLVAQIGDILASHEVLGFMPPSASLFCRLCYIKRKDMWEDGTKLGAPRTTASHARDVIAASTGNIMSQRACGVKGPGLIKGLGFFDGLKCSVLDLFHDFLQGTNKMEVKLALREYVCIKKYFTVEVLNSRIQFFDYGFVDKKNKPTANMTADYLNNIKTYNLPQTGSQVWCLTRVFGFLVGDLVPEDDKFLRLISLLNQITAIAFSRVLSPDDVNNLDDLIQAHHRLFQEIFPQSQQTEDEVNEEDVIQEEIFQDVFDTNVDEELLRINEEACDDPDDTMEDSCGPSTSQATSQETQRRKKKKKKVIRMINKHHKMLHYPDLIRRMGPLILYCTIRYEARHYFFKLVATVCHNFINVLKTLMEMIQMKIAADRNMQKSRVEMAKRGTKLLSVFDTPHSHQLVAAGVLPSSKVYQVNFVIFDRVDYRPELFVTLKNQTRGTFPLFAQIKAVYLSQNEELLYLVTQEWKTERFEPKYCAYHVLPQSAAPFVVKQPSEIATYRLLSAWKRFDSDKTYLAPRTIA